MKVGAQRAYAANGVELYLWQRFGEKLATAEPLVMKEAQEMDELRPFVTLSMEAAQMLIDELWNAGLRPKYAQATDETTAAQRAHIDDLRTIVTRLLDLSARLE